MKTRTLTKLKGREVKTQTPLDLVLDRLGGASGGIRDGSFKLHCPAHDDNRESLSVSEGTDGRALLKCHAGCALEDILGKIKLKVTDLFPRKGTVEYSYRDERGTLLYQAVRKETRDGKTFFQRRPDPDRKGEWINNAKDVRLVLYRLPDLKGRKVVYVVEGEKDAESLWALDLAATTNVGGAGKWRDEYAEQLKAAGVESVAVLRDNDDAGERHQATVAASCHAVGLAVKTVELPGLPEKGDVTDWLQAGHTRDDFAEILRGTPRYGPAPVMLEGQDHIDVPPMPEEGYIGLAAEYAEIMSKISEAPKPFLYFSFLTHLGTRVAAGLRLKSSMRQPARLYTALLAPTGAKKSAAIYQTREFFKRARHGDLGYYVLQGASSGEGMADALRKLDDEERFMLYEIDELLALQSKMQIKGSSLLSALLSLFEETDWQTRTKYESDSVEVHDAHLSLLGATTFDSWETLFTAEQIRQGLLDRFWFVPAIPAQKVAIPGDYPPAYLKLAKTVGKLLAVFFNPEQPMEVRLSPEADRMFSEWYAALPQNEYTVRLDAYVLRLGTLLAVSSDGLDEETETVTISRRVMKAALALADWQHEARRRFWPIVFDDRMGKVQTKIRRVLVAVKGGLTRGELIARTNAMRGSLKLFDEALGLLIREGFAEKREGKKGPRGQGRPGYRYFSREYSLSPGATVAA